MVAARYIYEQSNIVTKWSKISSTCCDPVSLVLWYVQAPNNQQSNTLSGKKHCTTVPSHNYSIQCSTFVKCQLHYKTINSFYRIVTNWQRFLLKFLPIFKSISCFFSNISSQSHRIPCFSGISIGIEFYWQSIKGAAGSQVLIVFAAPGTIGLYPGRAL